MAADNSIQTGRRDRIQVEPEARRTLPLVSVWIFLGAVMLGAIGCSVQDHKKGQSENIKLHTPIGSFDVRTNSIHGPDVGLPIYPGAMETGKHGKDGGSADIQINVGSWNLNVKAIEYRSSDPEDKIIAFYRNAMARYGDVLTCKNKIAIGQPSKTRQGLTCANDHEYDVNMRLDVSRQSTNSTNIQADSIGGNIKLLAGSPSNQHIIEFNPTADGTKFSMIVVQLPHKSQTD